jgi:hypothetical protein
MIINHTLVRLIVFDGAGEIRKSDGEERYEESTTKINKQENKQYAENTVWEFLHRYLETYLPVS